MPASGTKIFRPCTECKPGFIPEKHTCMEWDAISLSSNENNMDKRIFRKRLNTVAYTLAFLISPVLLIWAVNTLFDLKISFTVQNWIAGLVLFILLRFHTGIFRFSTNGDEDCDYDFAGLQEDYEEFMMEDRWDPFHPDSPKTDKEPGRKKNKGKLIFYLDHKKKRNSPPEGKP